MKNFQIVWDVFRLSGNWPDNPENQKLEKFKIDRPGTLSRLSRLLSKKCSDCLETDQTIRTIWSWSFENPPSSAGRAQVDRRYTSDAMPRVWGAQLGGKTTSPTTKCIYNL